LPRRVGHQPAGGQGYGQFVLGELAFVEGDYAAAHRYLSAFVTRTTSGRVALAIALEGEVRRARRLLRLLRGKRQRPSE
jgi:hypothetical protein